MAVYVTPTGGTRGPGATGGGWQASAPQSYLGIGLYSFTPVSPDYNNKIYYLPPVSQEDKRTVTLNRSNNAFVELEEGDGAYPTAGMLPAYLSYCEINIIFDIVRPWLDLTGYPPGPMALEQALNDFTYYVTMSGEGILSDRYYRGDYDSSGNPFISVRTTHAWLSNTISVTRKSGGTYAQVECTFISPSGKWTMSDSSGLAYEMYIY